MKENNKNQIEINRENIEKSIKILHPDTSADEIIKAEYYGGFRGKEAGIKLVEEACLIACDIMKRELRRNCNNCNEKEKCAIFDNFNIKYCSDFNDEKG